jgi:hypothetical protein
VDNTGKKNAPIEASPVGEAARPTDRKMLSTIIYQPACAEKSDAELADAEETIAGGTLLKHFRIMRLIGRGGMGDVYEAHDESLERTVAIKVIRAGKNIAPADHARLVQEARAQARLNHPHVVQIYYVGLEPDCPFLAMEIVRGTTLAENLSRRALPFSDIVRVALQVIEALRRAADMEIVHADIKPSNILLDEKETVKLSDFGLAQRNLTDETRTGVLQGTPKYMAPELLKGAHSSIASDMYALGIMLFEMTLGRYPYGPAATTIQQHFDLHRSAEVSFPKPWPAEIPEGWKEVLVRLLAKQPENRYADYSSLFAEVVRFRPTTRLPAALLPRGLAWSIDLILLSIILVSMQVALILLKLAPVGLSEGWAVHIAGLTLHLLQAAAFGLLVMAHARTNITPGKWLFQISIADQHGLPSAPSRLMLRMMLSQFPISAALVYDLLEDLTADKLTWLFPLTVLVTGVWLFGNVISMLIDKRRLALHDRLLQTRAVIDRAG